MNLHEAKLGSLWLTKVVLCPSCNGKGVTAIIVYEDGMEQPFICGECQGTCKSTEMVEYNPSLDITIIRDTIDL